MAICRVWSFCALLLLPLVGAVVRMDQMIYSLVDEQGADTMFASLVMTSSDSLPVSFLRPGGVIPIGKDDKVFKTWSQSVKDAESGSTVHQISVRDIPKTGPPPLLQFQSEDATYRYIFPLAPSSIPQATPLMTLTSCPSAPVELSSSPFGVSFNRVAIGDTLIVRRFTNLDDILIPGEALEAMLVTGEAFSNAWIQVSAQSGSQGLSLDVQMTPPEAGLYVVSIEASDNPWAGASAHCNVQVGADWYTNVKAAGSNIKNGVIHLRQDEQDYVRCLAAATKPDLQKNGDVPPQQVDPLYPGVYQVVLGHPEPAEYSCVASGDKEYLEADITAIVPLQAEIMSRVDNCVELTAECLIRGSPPPSEVDFFCLDPLTFPERVPANVSRLEETEEQVLVELRASFSELLAECYLHCESSNRLSQEHASRRVWAEDDCN